MENDTAKVTPAAIHNADHEIENWSDVLADARAGVRAIQLAEKIEFFLNQAIRRRSVLRNEDAIERAFVAKRVANRLERADLHAEASRQFDALRSDVRYDDAERDTFAAHAAEHDNRAKGKPWVPVA